jgi:hypothetical protein
MNKVNKQIKKFEYLMERNSLMHEVKPSVLDRFNYKLINTAIKLKWIGL